MRTQLVPFEMLFIKQKVPAMKMKRLMAVALMGSGLGGGVCFTGCDVDRSADEAAKEVAAPAVAVTDAKPVIEKEEAGAAFYVVDHYDAKRDPAMDLAAAMERATAEKKRILIQVGGDWCGWCKLMSKYMESDEAVRENLTKNFLVMKVTYEDGQKNEAFLSKYPAISGYPHLFVVGGDGTLLHSQETGSLEEGRGYNQEKYLAFLDAWKL